MIVWMTALGVGSATVIGALIGFLFRRGSHRFSDIVLAFAAGVMLAAAVLGLILPSLEYGGSGGVFVTVIGIFVGALFLHALDKLIPHLHLLTGVDQDGRAADEQKNRILLFVLAIAIHNFPEGIAAGVGFGLGPENQAEALLLAGGIALQNIPEGMVIISPMLAAGIPPKKTFLYAALTGVVEIVGTVIGYFAVSVATAVLPFALAFAGGTMLYIISDEMIPETHAHGNERAATWAILVGFCLMLLFDALLA